MKGWVAGGPPILRNYNAMEKTTTDEVFVREKGLNFTKIIISPIDKKRYYRADFKFWVYKETFRVNTSIIGKGFRGTIWKVQKFLNTELAEDEFEIHK